jgi:transcriptional regulator with XRE-family HTH domain
MRPLAKPNYTFLVRTKRGAGRESRTVPGIGARLRQARLKAGLTQQRLAGDRYTKAYVSALENGLVNPSMVALEYLASRLGTSASTLIADDKVGWRRLEADLLLAAGEWQAAADAYEELLPQTVDPVGRADILRSSAEALARLERLEEAVTAANEAVEVYQSAGRDTDAALAAYWLAAALHYQGEVDEARSILTAIVDKVRAGLELDPDYRLRVLIALSRSEARAGNHDVALSYTEEIRGLASDLDYRQRASYLFDQARALRERGEHEAAMQAGYAARALFEAARAEVKMASLDNDLAASHLAAGNSKRAAELAANARQTFERLGDSELLAFALETEARVHAAENDHDAALKLAAQSLALAEDTGNKQAAVNALLTTARIRSTLGMDDDAKSAYQQAALTARSLGRRHVIREALTEWADYLAGTGEHRAAFELTREALSS